MIKSILCVRFSIGATIHMWLVQCLLIIEAIAWQNKDMCVCTDSQQPASRLTIVLHTGTVRIKK